MKIELRLFRCFVAMLPKLRAEEELGAINRGHAFTERPMDQRNRGQYIAGLERARSGEDQSSRRMSQAHLAAMASVGVAVRRVGAAADEED